MIIKVNPHTIDFTQDVEFNSGEYNITTLEFDFSNEFNGLTNQAVFSTCNGTYKTPILNNQCVIPYEVLEEPGQVLLGVFGYEGDENLTLRYSPTPKYFNVKHGSYKEGNEPQIPPKSEWEQLVEEINKAITETNNLNVSATKEGTVTTITVTKKDGTTYQVQILDGEKGDKGDKGEPGAIKMQIVNELPTTGEEDTIYLVPIDEPETGNNYDEYIYTNGQWEKLGGVQVEVDLTDYVKNTDYASVDKGGVIKVTTSYGAIMSAGHYLQAIVDTYAQYQNRDTYSFISKGTLENVITGKGLITNTVNNLTNYYTKTEIDNTIGDINSLLDTINGEVI